MDVGVGVRLALAFAAVVLLAAACGGDEPSEPSSADGDIVDLYPPPLEAVELFQLNLTVEELNLTADEVSEAVGGTYPTNPHSPPRVYEERWKWWFMPSADSSGPGPKPGSPEPQLESFAMPDRYYEAGFLGFAVKRFSRPSGEIGWVAKPTQIDLGVAEYEDSEGAQEALGLGARIYGLFPLATHFAHTVHAGEEVFETYELTGLGDGAIVDLAPGAAAISVRVDCYVGTVIVPYSLRGGASVPPIAEPLAAALAEKLAATR